MSKGGKPNYLGEVQGKTNLFGQGQPRSQGGEDCRYCSGDGENAGNAGGGASHSSVRGKGLRPKCLGKGIGETRKSL